MNRAIIRLTLALVVCAPAFPQTRIAAGGWTVTAGQGRIEIAHERLGTVITDMRLNVRNGGKTIPLEQWTAEANGTNRLAIRTARPNTGWQIDLEPNIIRIRSTAYDALITGTAPSPKERVVARTIDPQGEPVDWVGTSEVVGNYGGSETHNRSFLPRRNPDCMYFALGQVSSANFHSLFDRKTDTAIEFPESAVLDRSTRDADMLELAMPVEGYAAVRLIPDYMTQVLGVPYYVPFDDSYFRRAPMVWSSWTSYYDAVREQDIVRNADWLAANLKPYGFEYVQLDDGYDRAKNGAHCWIEHWDRNKFPRGPQWLAGYIQSKGLRAGLWLVPNAYACATEHHPDWYLRDKKGGFVLDYRTPALDSTNPEVLTFVQHLLQTLDTWGFDYYKFDGEHALPRYAPVVDREKLHNPKADLLANYRERLRLIRKTIGPKRFIEGCPAGTPLNGIGYFNSYFTGHDLYNNWQGMYPLFSSINANAFLNHLLVYVMPGEGLELGLPMSVEEAEKKRPPVVVATARTREDPLTGFGLNDREARTLVTYVALTGVAYPLASVMPELPQSRVKLLKMTLPTMPILPVDLFSRGTDMQWDKFKHTQPDFYIHNYPETLDLKVNEPAGNYDVVAVTNWRGEPMTRDLDFADKLGLSAGARFVVFDFWNQQTLGVFQGRMPVTVEPHDTQVLLIHRLLDRPQLIGISRHITGAYSIVDLAWDAAHNTLRGTSETVAGDPYMLWIHVPDGMKARYVTAVLENGTEIPVESSLSGNTFRISFAGQTAPVRWRAEF